MVRPGAGVRGVKLSRGGRRRSSQGAEAFTSSSSSDSFSNCSFHCPADKTDLNFWSGSVFPSLDLFIVSAQRHDVQPSVSTLETSSMVYHWPPQKINTINGQLIWHDRLHHGIWSAVAFTSSSENSLFGWGPSVSGHYGLSMSHTVNVCPCCVQKKNVGFSFSKSRPHGGDATHEHLTWVK